MLSSSCKPSRAFSWSFALCCLVLFAVHYTLLVSSYGHSSGFVHNKPLLHSSSHLMDTPELHVCVVACCIHYSDPLPSLPVGESSLKEAPHCSGAPVYRENVRQFMIVCECVGACVGVCGCVCV